MSSACRNWVSWDTGCSPPASSPLQKKVDAILAHPRPASLQELQGFLGTVNFYHRFLPAATKLLLPLTEALRGCKAAKETIAWTAEMVAAFTATKEAALLAHPSPGAEIALGGRLGGTT